MAKVWVIISYGYADALAGLMAGHKSGAEGKYLEWYEPNAEPGKGVEAELGGWTDDPAKAKVFASAAEAWTCWKQERTAGPNTNVDGRKNRPLTAFTIEVKEIEQ